MSAAVGEWLAAGGAIDLILALFVLEAIALGRLWRRGGGGVPPGQMLCNLAAGGAIMVALRLSIAGAAWGWILAALAASCVAHLGDLALRWRSPTQCAKQRPAALGVFTDRSAR